MGARWPWHAICEEGHITNGFSGGSDGECELWHSDANWCGKPILEETNCWDDGYDDGPCGCKEGLMRTWREFDNARRQMNLFDE